MLKISHKQVRHARDRLIDLLGLGRTYPLRDLDIKDEGLTVPFNASALIPIEASQPDVRYSLYTREDQPVFRAPNEPAEADGNGGVLLIESPAITEDITYKVKAAKFHPKRSVDLHQTATVKVGLDVSLQAVILNAHLLDPAIETPTAASPRIVNYGANVQVKLLSSQQGVDYHLVERVAASGGSQSHEIRLSPDIRGTRGDILLLSRAILEDTDIRIRAVKKFDPAENRPDQTTLLKIVLPLKVRANRENQTTLSPDHVIAYHQSAAIAVLESQTSVSYRLYQRIIADQQIIHGTPGSFKIIKVAVLGEPDVQIREPELPSVWTALDEFLPVGDRQQGNGGELKLMLPTLGEESLIIVKAEKEHRAALNGEDRRKISSAVPLKKITAILVRPDPSPPLILKVPLKDSATGNHIEVLNGQPGVFYFMHTTHNDERIGLPAYFHKRDGIDSRLNKGIGQLKIGVDFVMTAADLKSDSTDPSATAPLPPVVDVISLALDASIKFHALKAQTRVGVDLDQTALIPTAPEITLLEPVVDFSAVATIRIVESRTGERYQMARNGQTVGDAVVGTGGDLNLETDPLTGDALVWILMTRPEEKILVERSVTVKITVRPDPTLTVRAMDEIVAKNTGTRIGIEASQKGVIYYLRVGENQIKDTIAGTGATIYLSTGPIETGTTFHIWAANAANNTVGVRLNQQVQVNLSDA